ncbi:MAG: class I SAM-dependent methyltransferase [Patescibacteria group bacterium]|nr:class I SAM-dependent methyltransferase [Patescibacteria group bacterium]
MMAFQTNQRIERLLKRYGREDSPEKWDFFVGHRPLVRYRMNRQIKKILELIQKNRKNVGEFTLLDIGCGTGRYLNHFLSLGKTVGVDISEPMLEKARKNTKDQAILIKADAENLPFKDNTFDVVTCSYLFENLNGPKDNPKKVFKEMYRVTKKGGQIIFTVETWYSIPNLISYILSFLKRKTPLNFYSVKKIRKLTTGVNPQSVKIYGLSPITVFFPWARDPFSMVKLIEKIDDKLEKFMPSFGAQLIVEIKK